MVRTTAAEREEIREVLAGIHNAVFEEQLEPSDIELTQLTSDDNEMDAYHHRIGVNIKLWRRWSTTQMLEVVLHELAHVAEPEDGHRPSFWERFIDIVETAEAHQDEIEDVLGEPVDFEMVKRRIVEEVHEDIIDRRMDTVRERKRWCRERFGL